MKAILPLLFLFAVLVVSGCTTPSTEPIDGTGDGTTGNVVNAQVQQAAENTLEIELEQAIQDLNLDDIEGALTGL
ncbi:MAG: hypothetical protein ABIJ92_04635 [Candidatus Aenigmatarchaeota archaeon]